jgi:4-hydroxy-tetrahydrodipicolinate synthase
MTISLGKILIPLPTPFAEDYSVDYRKAAQLAKKVSEFEFTDSIVILATSGEFTSLTFDEKIELFKTVRKSVKKPIIAGTGATTTTEALNLTKAAEDAGVDAATIVPPYYCKPTQEGIYKHFKTIAEAVKIPIMIYNVGFTGVNIEPDTIAKLSKIENIIALKEMGNAFQVGEVVEKASKGFSVYAGSSLWVPFIIAQGGVGAVCECLIGEDTKRMIEHYLSGRIREGLEIYFKIIHYFKLYGTRANGVPLLKYAMNLAGFEVGKPRPPLTEATEQEKEIVKKTLTELKII